MSENMYSEYKEDRVKVVYDDGGKPRAIKGEVIGTNKTHVMVMTNKGKITVHVDDIHRIDEKNKR